MSRIGTVTCLELSAQGGIVDGDVDFLRECTESAGRGRYMDAEVSSRIGAESWRDGALRHG